MGGRGRGVREGGGCRGFKERRGREEGVPFVLEMEIQRKKSFCRVVKTSLGVRINWGGNWEGWIDMICEEDLWDF